MVLTKELILSVLERNSKQFKINGFTLTILDKVDWGKAAKEILEVQNFSSEEQPQLNKHEVSRSKCAYHAAFTFCGDNGVTYCSNCGNPV